MAQRSEVSSMSGVQWSSVSAYLGWLEANAGLTAFSIGDVYSFHVGRGGFDGLARKKSRLAVILEGNLRQIEAWVARNESSIEKTEMVFVRSLWKTTEEALEMVREHASRASHLAKNYKTYGGFLIADEGDVDDLPF